jgi:hypothetical protein
MGLRHRNRKLNRPLNRRLTQFTTTMLHGASRPAPPNYLSAALAAFARAIRAHRRLMNLAPDRFDYGIVRQNRLAREKEEQRMAKWEAVICKVYGLTELSPEAARALRPQVVKKTNPRTARVIERELENWIAWLAAGHDFLSLFEQQHRTDKLSLTTIARLLDTAMTLGRLSTGRETNWKEPKPDPAPAWNFEEALAKVYGPPSDDCTDPEMSGGAKTVQ